MSTSNLLEETIKILQENGKTEDDVVWVGCKTFKTSWEHFSEIADIRYNDGYGGAEVAGDLVVVGSDFWLERHEYDGSEWWEFKCLPKEPDKIFNFSSVLAVLYDRLEETENKD